MRQRQETNKLIVSYSLELMGKKQMELTVHTFQTDFSQNLIYFERERSLEYIK